MSGLDIYRTAVAPEWIDYNGHLRDAYYVLIVSQATDALMDRLGLDAAYRTRTHCTLYTLELHIHYLHEVRSSDTAVVRVRILAADHKRIHAAFELSRATGGPAAAAAEVMLLHVCQQPEGVVSAPFPAAVTASLAALQVSTAATPAAVPGSRRLELRGGRPAP
ncbi:MAG TPA: thioesterase family protein [Steroidobacteraceae bacterium]|nr:thioesterase family protein [Steroidobacteraceae bacterium]